MFAAYKRKGGVPPTFILAIALVLAFLSPCCGSPSEQTVTLVQGVGGYSGCTDTWLDESNEYNNGDDDDLYVRYDANYDYDRVTLIRFDLSGVLPSGACVKSATLRLYQYGDHNMNSSDWLKVGAYRLMKDWTEGTGSYTGASWSYRHANRTYPWMISAARGVDSDTDADRHHTHHVSHPYTGIADSVVTITEGARWVEWDVTPSVQYWVSNPSGNYGLVLDWWHEGPWHYDDNSGANMRSKEYADTNYRPQLVIKYVIPTAETDINLKLSDLTLNYWSTDPGITFSANDGQLLCSGTTTDSIWGMNGCATTYSVNSSFEARVKVKLQQGIVNVDQGQFCFGMYQPSNNNYIRLQAVGYSAHYYEISGICAASGNGEYHDGSAYWASYWDAVYPTYPPSSPAVRFFAETPEDEANAYLTWKLRYDKTNGMFYVFVNDVLVTYYSKVNFSNWLLAIAHDNNRSGVPTTVWTDFIDTTPPTPNPMTWASPPTAAGTTSISMTATTATDEHPPVSYYFTETSGNPGGSSYGWTTSTTYTDYGLSVNTQYGYKVKARDGCSTPNVGSDSTIAYAYTLINTPTGCTAGNATATTIDLAATGSLPNITQGLSGTLFATTGGEWTGSWRTGLTTDTATGLTPNTSYTFHVKARNGDGIATGWSSGTATLRTLAAQPVALAYGPVSCQGIQANWGANGNPPGTEYLCVETMTGKSSGWITDTCWVLTGLEPNRLYRFQVMARNADGVKTAYTNLGSVRTLMTIGQAKQLGIGAQVTLDNKVVTAVFKNIAFIEDLPAFGRAEGVAGIGVRMSGPAVELREGMVIRVDGQLDLNDPPFEQELIIRANNVQPIVQLGMVPPYGANNKWLGGGEFGSQPRVCDDASVLPPRWACGLSSIGMLVRAWGRVNDGGLGGVNYFWIDDGSALNDGQATGVRVSLEPIGGALNPLPEFGSVTGIMRCMVVHSTTGGSYNVRVIWPRRASDIVEYRMPPPNE